MLFIAGLQGEAAFVLEVLSYFPWAVVFSLTFSFFFYKA